MSTPLLRTKFFLPIPHPDLVSRPRLIKKLDLGLSRKLSLISAPAGFGKTTLLSEWTQHLLSGGEQTKAAWLSLDENDNELPRFLTYFSAALQTIDSNIGQGIISALQSAEKINIEIILTILLNEISEYPHDIVLILDDYHTIDSQSIDQALIYLIEHLPSGIHLVIGSRSDPAWPLARMRARGQMTEIRANDLRFTIDETAAFLNQVVNYKIPVEYISSLEQRTEGWITGLQLAALSMQNSSSAGEFVRAFSGSNRYILDYLGEEVLAHQSDDIQSFLIQTSILKHLSAPLCNALTQNNDGNEMLERLEKGNLFIIPLDNERRWYRYHHLFGDLLYRHLNHNYSEQITKLHQLASNWYLNDGQINEAVHHALEADDKEKTANILEDHWQVFFFRGELNKLKRILNALGTEITDNSLILRMAYCMIYSQTGEIRKIPDHTAFIRKKIYNTPKPDLKRTSNLAAIPALYETMEAIVALENGQPSKAKNHAQKAITLIPKDVSQIDQNRLILGANFRLGQAYKQLGEFDQACSILLEVLEILKTIGSFYTVNTAMQVVDLYQETGKKQEAKKLCEEILDFIAEKHWNVLPPAGKIHLSLAELQADRHNFEAAKENLNMGWDLLKQQTTPEIINKVKKIKGKIDNFSHTSQSIIEPLSQRELEILRLIAKGYTNHEIGERLFLALSTVKGHNRNIYDKLGVHRRTEAVARARELDLL